MEKGFLDFLDSLPVNTQVELKAKIAGKPQEEIVQVIQDYIPDKDVYKQYIITASQVTFKEYIDTILPILIPARKQELLNYLSSLENIPNPKV